MPNPFQGHWSEKPAFLLMGCQGSAVHDENGYTVKYLLWDPCSGAQPTISIVP